MNTSPIIIREATDEDALEIAIVHVESWRSTYVGQVPQAHLDQLSAPQREISWRQKLSDARLKVLVAEAEKVIVGFSSFGPSRDADAQVETAELYAIYLLEESKGRGIGRLLWNETLKILQALGFKDTTLWVLEPNTRARDFYEKVGFTDDGKSKEVDIGGEKVQERRYRLTIHSPSVDLS